MDDILGFTIEICAVIFGADLSLLKISLGREFDFKVMSLVPLINHIDIIFNTDAMGLRNEYESAVVDENLNVICAYKTYTTKIVKTKAKDYFDQIHKDALIYLDNRIRAIRLFVEGPVRFKKLSIKMQSETKQINKCDTGFIFSNIIPVGEAMGTIEISRFHCNDESINKLNHEISLINFPLNDLNLNNCHRYYDLSYHQELFISITLLVTCLEMLFLKNENAKKEKLAKRCSVFLYGDKINRLYCYNRLMMIYSKRSEIVHEGKHQCITNEDILFLRECVRKSLILYLKNKYDKKIVINSLKTIITDLDYWNVEE